MTSKAKIAIHTCWCFYSEKENGSFKYFATTFDWLHSRFNTKRQKVRLFAVALTTFYLASTVAIIRKSPVV